MPPPAPYPLEPWSPDPRRDSQRRTPLISIDRAAPRLGTITLAGSSVEQTPFTLEYLARLKEQEPETERHFVNHFTSVLQSRLRFRLRSRQMIDDVCQETLLRVIVHVRKGTAIERLPAFVHAVSKNVLLEAFRGQRKHPIADEDLPDLPDVRIDFDASLVSAQRQKAIAQILAELPEKDRRILQRLFLDEADREQICAELEVDSEYLRVLLHRAKTRFRSAMVRTRGAAASLLSFLL
jgi:RNA polymerase sigma-70 factor, ECF subfamily